MELGELANVAPPFLEDSDKCPFCGKPEDGEPHNKDEAKKKVDLDKIVSKPKDLNCGDLSPMQSQGKYGRAQHHIIPAIQCFKMVPRVAKMALQVDYDINNPKNGIPLPTVWNPYKVKGRPRNFGDLTDEQKDKIRNGVMKDLGAQWHVGNHSYSINECETENMADEGKIDHQPYDIEVIKSLIRLGLEIEDTKICEQGKDKNSVKDLLDELSDDIIRSKLDAFKTSPSSSEPYFVSAAALKFSRGK